MERAAGIMRGIDLKTLSRFISYFHRLLWLIRCDHVLAHVMGAKRLSRSDATTGQRSLVLGILMAVYRGQFSLTCAGEGKDRHGRQDCPHRLPVHAVPHT